MPTSETARAAGELLVRLQNLFMRHAHAENAAPMRAYMKGKFLFYGIKSPERKSLSQQFLRDNGPIELPVLAALFRQCFSAEQREIQYFVQDAGRRSMRSLDTTFLPVFHDLIGKKSWWDTVDFLSPKLAGRLLLRFPERVRDFPDQWIENDDFWYQRSAILFQLDYKAATDWERLKHYILRRSESGEFFVQKAAGWALRQYSKVEPDRVRTFVEAHTLAPLTVREGLKVLRKEKG